MRIIAGKRYNSHTAPLFKKYSILPLEQLAKFSKLSIMYDFARNKMPISFRGFWKKNSCKNTRTYTQKFQRVRARNARALNSACNVV